MRRSRWPTPPSVGPYSIKPKALMFHGTIELLLGVVGPVEEKRNPPTQRMTQSNLVHDVDAIRPGDVGNYVLAFSYGTAEVAYFVIVAGLVPSDN